MHKGCNVPWHPLLPLTCNDVIAEDGREWFIFDKLWNHRRIGMVAILKSIICEVSCFISSLNEQIWQHCIRQQKLLLPVPGATEVPVCQITTALQYYTYKINYNSWKYWVSKLLFSSKNQSSNDKNGQGFWSVLNSKFNRFVMYLKVCNLVQSGWREDLFFTMVQGHPHQGVASRFFRAPTI